MHRPKLNIDWHSHETAAVVLTLNGCVTERFSFAQFERVKGSVLIRPAGERHCDFVGQEQTRLFVIDFSAAWIEGLPAFAVALRRPSLHRAGAISLLAQRVHREWQHSDNASQIAIQALVLEIAAHLIREGASKSGARPPIWLRHVKQRLDDGFAKTPSLAELAHVAGVHPTHLARNFRYHYRKSIGEYLRRRRVEVSMELLHRGELTLTEIALEAGFAHHAHFTTIFKRLVGLTPSEFRRMSSYSAKEM